MLLRFTFLVTAPSKAVNIGSLKSTLKQGFKMLSALVSLAQFNFKNRKHGVWGAPNDSSVKVTKKQ